MIPQTTAFLNTRGGVGTTTLVYNLGHMMAHLGHRVLMVDLDPRGTLTAMCLPVVRQDEVWHRGWTHPDTILGVVAPLLQGSGDIHPPHLEVLDEGLALVPGDLGLSLLEEALAEAWSLPTGHADAARILLSFYRTIQAAAACYDATTVLVDLGPGLGAVNRTALLSCRFLVSPITMDNFSIRGLQDLGTVLPRWRLHHQRLRGWSAGVGLAPRENLPTPLGYVLVEDKVRGSGLLREYDLYEKGVEAQYHESLLLDDERPARGQADPWCLGVMRHYRTLMPLAQEARKPIFLLKAADGAMSAHLYAVQEAYKDFKQLATTIAQRANAQID